MRLAADGWYSCADCGELTRPATSVAGPQWLIWSETRMLWWRRARQDRGIDGDGYTDHAIFAGQWTREEAEKIQARHGSTKVTLVDVSAEERATLEAARVLYRVLGRRRDGGS